MCQINLARCQTHKIITRTKTNWAKEVRIDTNTKQIGNHGNVVHALRYVHVQWTTYRIVGNFHWCKSAQSLQKKFSQFFIFTECGMLWLHPYQLMWHLQIVSFLGSLVFCTADYSLQQPFRGQTDCREPSRSHGYSMYAHNDVINFHLSSFFAFLFSQKQAWLQKSGKFEPSKNFPLYGINDKLWNICRHQVLAVCSKYTGRQKRKLKLNGPTKS